VEVELGGGIGRPYQRERKKNTILCGMHAAVAASKPTQLLPCLEGCSILSLHGRDTLMTPEDQALADQPSQRRLARLHLLARAGDQGGKLQTIALGEFESGHWAIPAEMAAQMISAEIHLHERQADKSWMAGHVVGARPSDTMPGRFVLRFQVDRSLCRTHRTGWGIEQSRVWAEESS
jgi:hypothetical protein